MIQTVICDDHPLITQGLLSYMERHKTIEVVASVASAKELMDLLPTLKPDVLLLDVQLPDGNGVDLCLKIKKQYPYIQILGLSNLDDRNLILKMLSHGASGYLLKSAAMDEIEKAIVHIQGGGLYLGGTTEKSLRVSKIDLPEETPPITRREKEVLHYLAQGLSSAKIAHKMFISPLTVNVHRRNLMHKFKVNNTISLLQKTKNIRRFDPHDT